MKPLRSRRLMWGALALFVLVLGATFAGRALRQNHVPAASAQAAAHLAIDADPTNGVGPCDPVDSERTVATGTTYQVAVCIVDPPEAPWGFEIGVQYNEDINSVPEVEDPVPALDDNPDANAGATTFSSPDLGTGWDCSGVTVLPPTSDDPATSEVDATIVCLVNLVEPVATLTQTGPLAVITFEATGSGDEVLTFSPRSAVIGSTSTSMGRCSDLAPTIDCFGATIHKQEGGVPAPTPTATPPVTGPAPTPTPLAPGLEAVDLVAGCNPLASTYPNDTPVQTIAGNVGPAGVLISLWEFELGNWLGYSPQAPPEASDLQEGDFLDVLFVCVSGTGAFVRPVA